jgi:cytochrome b561
MNQGYRWPLVSLHWLTLLLIAAAFVIGNVLEDMALSPLKLKLYAWHKWLGMTVLFLLPLRLLARATERLDQSVGLLPWEARASLLVHAALYLLMFAVPFLGWLSSSAAGFQVVWFGVLPLPDLLDKNKELGDLLQQVHMLLNFSMAALVVAHLGAALKHHFIDRDDILARMIPFLGTATGGTK